MTSSSAIYQICSWTKFAFPYSPDENRGLIQEFHLDEFIQSLRTGSPLPSVVADRLHLFVEADSYLLHEVQERNWFPPMMVLVSNNKKLAIRIEAIIHSKDWGPGIMVLMIDPIDYLYGRLDFHLDVLCRDSINHEVLVDFGCISCLVFCY